MTNLTTIPPGHTCSEDWVSGCGDGLVGPVTSPLCFEHLYGTTPERPRIRASLVAELRTFATLDADLIARAILSEAENSNSLTPLKSGAAWRLEVWLDTSCYNEGFENAWMPHVEVCFASKDDADEVAEWLVDVHGSRSTKPHDLRFVGRMSDCGTNHTVMSPVQAQAAIGTVVALWRGM